MKKDIRIFIRHILESIELIESYLEKKSERDFLSSTMLQDSVIRRIEIIGEAVKNLTNSFKKDHPDIPWKEIAGVRDILIHQYFGVDLNLTWQIAIKDIPELKIKLTKIMKSMD